MATAKHLTSLQVKVEEAGDQITFPARGATVMVRHEGRLHATQVVFDSSKGAGKAPLRFQLGVGHVIRGWDEGIAQMSLGSKATIFVPAALGFGDRDIGRGLIPPNSDLEFDVELLAIE
jgi:FKBP-type peptidyl-prolyl cis-trans isomerase